MEMRTGGEDVICEGTTATTKTTTTTTTTTTAARTIKALPIVFLISSEGPYQRGNMIG